MRHNRDPLHSLHAVRRWYWRLARPSTRGSRVLILDGERVLLVRHSYGRHWYLPGGGVRRRETFEDAARREVFEEIGVNVHDLRLFNRYLSRQEGKRDHIEVFTATMYEGVPRVRSREIAEVRLHPMSDLPDDVSPATRRRIIEYLGGSTSDVW